MTTLQNQPAFNLHLLEFESSAYLVSRKETKKYFFPPNSQLECSLPLKFGPGQGWAGTRVAQALRSGLLFTRAAQQPLHNIYNCGYRGLGVRVRGWRVESERGGHADLIPAAGLRGSCLATLEPLSPALKQSYVRKPLSSRGALWGKTVSPLLEKPTGPQHSLSPIKGREFVLEGPNPGPPEMSRFS